MRLSSHLCFILAALLAVAFAGWLYAKLQMPDLLPDGFIGVWLGGYTIIGASALLFIVGVFLRLMVRRPQPAPALAPAPLSTPPGAAPRLDGLRSSPPGGISTPLPGPAPTSRPPMTSPVSSPPASPLSVPPGAPASTPPAKPSQIVSLAAAQSTPGDDEPRSWDEAAEAAEAAPPVDPPAEAAPLPPVQPLAAPALSSFAPASAPTPMPPAPSAEERELADVLASLDSGGGAGVAFETRDVDDLFSGLEAGEIFSSLDEVPSAPSSPSSGDGVSGDRPVAPPMPTPSGAVGMGDLQARLQSLKSQIKAPREPTLPPGKAGSGQEGRNKFDVPTRRVPGQEMVSADLLQPSQSRPSDPKVAGRLAEGTYTPQPTPVFMRSLKFLPDSGLPAEPFEREISGMTAAEANTLWQEYVEANRRCGRDLTRLKSAVFQEHLERNFAAICKRFNCKKVQFSVKIKDGRVSLQATPVR